MFWRERGHSLYARSGRHPIAAALQRNRRKIFSDCLNLDAHGVT
jgi:hypothetical protein